MDSAELAEWAAYERVTGTLGPERDDLLISTLAAVTASPWTKRRVKPTDFAPKWDRDRVQSAEEMKRIVRNLNWRLGGTRG